MSFEVEAFFSVTRCADACVGVGSREGWRAENSLKAPWKGGSM